MRFLPKGSEAINFLLFSNNIGAVHQLASLPVRLADPAFDIYAWRSILKLNAHRPIKSSVAECLKIGRKRNNATAGRKIAMFLAITVRKMDVGDMALELMDRIRR